MPIVNEQRINPTHTTRTIYGSMQQCAVTSGTQHVWLENSTLNEKYNIQPKVYPNENPTLRYFGFGTGGQYMGKDVNGDDELKFYRRSADEASLYKPIPMVIRRKNNDLTEEQRKFYAGRSETVIGNDPVILYWLGKLDLTNTTTNAFIATPNSDGSLKEEEFNPSTDVLNPTPKRDTPGAVNLVSGKFGVTRSLYRISLASWQLDELINAKQILTQNSELQVNELFIAHGVEKRITTDVTYDEGLGVQIAAIFNKPIGINSYTGSNLDMDIDGGMDDRLALTVIE